MQAAISNRTTSKKINFGLTSVLTIYSPTFHNSIMGSMSQVDIPTNKFMLCNLLQLEAKAGSASDLPPTTPF